MSFAQLEKDIVNPKAWLKDLNTREGVSELEGRLQEIFERIDLDTPGKETVHEEKYKLDLITLFCVENYDKVSESAIQRVKEARVRLYETFERLYHGPWGNSEAFKVDRERLSREQSHFYELVGQNESVYADIILKNPRNMGLEAFDKYVGISTFLSSQFHKYKDLSRYAENMIGDLESHRVIEGNGMGQIAGYNPLADVRKTARRIHDYASDRLNIHVPLRIQEKLLELESWALENPNG